MPDIQLCVDESLDAATAKATFGKHGIRVDIITYTELCASLKSRGESLLLEFANAFFWGRKTALTFGLGDSRPVLYCDLDVLWFKDPWTAMQLGSLSGVVAGTDGYRAYDRQFIELLQAEEKDLLELSAPVCAGLYAVGPNYQIPDKLLKCIEKQLKFCTPGYFCEQTVLALIVKLEGKQLSYEEIPTCPKEQSVLRPSFTGKKWIAAHYAGPTRPQFWRDAFSSCRAS